MCDNQPQRVYSVSDGQERNVRILTILESVVNYVDLKSPESLDFLGGKERIWIPI